MERLRKIKDEILEWIKKPCLKGFYFPPLKIFLKIIDLSSLNSLIKERVNKKALQEYYQLNREKGFLICGKLEGGKWVSELYQIISLIVGILFLGLLLHITNKILLFVIFLFSLYRASEILIFLLNWIFVHENKILNYRRSLACFFVNIIEVSLYFTIFSIWSSCVCDGISKFTLFVNHLTGILTLSIPKPPLNNFCCNFFYCFEVLLSIFLLLIIIGTLVGGLLREEAKREKVKK